MITIKTVGENKAEINIKKGTPHTTIILGIEMLVEALIEMDENSNITIDLLLEDIKRIYERDNKGNVAG